MTELSAEKHKYVDDLMKNVAATMALAGRNATAETQNDEFSCLVVNLLIVIQKDDEEGGGRLVASAVGIDPDLPKGRVGMLMIERGMSMAMDGDDIENETLHINEATGEIVGTNGHIHGEDCDHGN